MSKYQEYYQRMIDFNKEAFASFQTLHDNYVKNPVGFKKEFNSSGQDILDIIREWEDKLCNHSESGKFGKFSNQMTDKFWDLIRKDFPKIDEVGLL